MENSWQDKIRKITPYKPGEQPKTKNIIKLNANENPYPPSPLVLEAIHNFDANSLRLYPAFNSKALISALSKTYGVPENKIFAGNGSDEVLALAFLAFFNSDIPVFFPDITYTFYDVWCKLFEIPYERKRLKDDFTIETKDYCSENGGVILPNPNAPTGMGEGREFIIDILRHNRDSVVIIDEAYVDFGAYSAVDLIEEYDNLLVVQTFSKSRSLAGLRIGHAFGSEKLISTLLAVKDSFNSYPLDSIAIAAGAASLSDEKYFKDTIGKIIKSRKELASNLQALGFKVYPSESNFLFVTNDNINAKDLFEYLKDKGILIRYFALPRIDNCLRITIGLNEENAALISLIKEYIKK